MGPDYHVRDWKEVGSKMICYACLKILMSDGIIITEDHIQYCRAILITGEEKKITMKEANQIRKEWSTRVSGHPGSKG